MKFFEAVEIARKTGKEIRTEGAVSYAAWRDYCMRWVDSNIPMLITSESIDADWQVIEPPPKEYDFAEAYKMMKAGKWMKPVEATLEHACINSEWRCRNSKSYYASCSAYLCWKHVDSKWIEVQP